MRIILKIVRTRTRLQARVACAALLAGVLFFACDGSGFAEDVADTYGELSNVQLHQEDFAHLFPIEILRPLEPVALQVPDHIVVEGRVLEIVQESERARFDPIHTVEIKLGGKPPEGKPDILRDRRKVYLQAVALAVRDYRRGEREKPRRPDGFSVRFEDDLGVPTAVIVLYDRADDARTDELLVAVRGLTRAVVAASASEVKALERLKDSVEAGGGGADTLRAIEAAVRKTSRDIDSLRGGFAEFSSDILSPTIDRRPGRTNLKEITDELVRIRKALQN